MIQCDHKKKMALTNIFVTVGTTKFDGLITVITSENVLKMLNKKKCKNLTIQAGKGIIPQVENNHGVNIEFFRFKDSLESEIDRADLIISHAGAGSCLSALHAGKQLLVVINETLMDNHQTELAQRLSQDGYLLFTTTALLADFLENELDFERLVPYPKGESAKYAKHIDRVMGFLPTGLI